MSQNHHFGRVEICPAERTLRIDGVPAELGSRAYDLLQALIKHRDRVVTKDELMDMVWSGMVVEENNLQAQVSSLRKLLGPKAITTIQGRGYQFSLAETVAANGAAVTSATLSAGVVTINDTPSIAVLAFANHSASADDEYFSEGLADELLNVLTKIKGLRVAARTSAFSFKGKDDDIASIGQKLNVATVLEGSVRKSGNRVRVSVQLVKVDDGFQIWSETYDRTLDDIFAVQDDIAQSVVSGLRSTLMDVAGSAGTIGAVNNAKQVADEIAQATQTRSHNPEAQRLALQARFYAGKRRPDDLQRAILFCEQAIALDPEYAGAYTTLSQAWLFSAFYAGPKTLIGNHVMTCFGHSRAAAESAHRLDPTDPTPHVNLSWIAWIGDHDAPTSMRELTTALVREPDNAEVLRNIGHRHMELGQFDQAKTLLDKGIALDPLSIPLRVNRAMLARFMGQPETSLQWCLTALEIDPANWWAHLHISRAYRDMGDYANAVKSRTLAEELRGDAATATLLREGYRTGGWHGYITASMGEPKEAIARYDLAPSYAERGEFDNAFAALDKILNDRGQQIGWFKVDPSLAPLHNDPRYAGLLKRAGFPE